MKDYAGIIQRLINFLKEESKNKGFQSVVFGLSGGIDSAVVAILCQKAFSQHSHALLMPSMQSSKQSVEDALMLCEKFRLPYTILPLEKMQEGFLQTLTGLGDNPLRMGNLCARLRMICLYDYAFTHHSLVIGTSNKSERMLGYGTIFGDLACGINPIGNLYKTEIYEIARILEIPQRILDKTPSADLYDGQSDEKELGFSYAVLDKIMMFLENGYSQEEILRKNLPKEALELVLRRMQTMEFKRKMPELALL
ncbi:NAD+ synthase [Helicobacter mesocricetorum]|uniref:NAD+ synthase n=1 Tax=Helicobacter mesocricetorum TaxID=87012 RepID=UPI000CF08FD2|nr:NAD+ synthase [Helicobacter mesocricetorum]